MTYWSSAYLIWRGFGSFATAGFAFGCSSISSSMISWQRLMHSSQMYTPCPAISFRTCSWLLPQNEHRYGTLAPLLPLVVLTRVPLESASRPLPRDLASSGLRLLLLRLRRRCCFVRLRDARPLAARQSGVVSLGDQ